MLSIAVVPRDSFLEAARDVADHAVEKRTEVAACRVCFVERAARLQALDEDILQRIVDLIVPGTVAPSVAEVAANRRCFVHDEPTRGSIDIVLDKHRISVTRDFDEITLRRLLELLPRC